MIYITGNRSNDATESQKEKKDLFLCSFSVQSVKNHMTSSQKLCYVKV